MAHDQRRGGFGVADQFGDSDTVPVFDRFFAGGLGTVRGFNFRRVGPIESGSAVGGASMAIVNLEYTFALPYLEKIAANLAANPDTSLTGPLARADATTVKANLAALRDDPYVGIYEAFARVIAPATMEDLE